MYKLFIAHDVDEEEKKSDGEAEGTEEKIIRRHHRNPKIQIANLENTNAQIKMMTKNQSTQIIMKMKSYKK